MKYEIQTNLNLIFHVFRQITFCPQRFLNLIEDLFAVGADGMIMVAGGGA